MRYRGYREGRRGGGPKGEGNKGVGYVEKGIALDFDLEGRKVEGAGLGVELGFWGK